MLAERARDHVILLEDKDFMFPKGLIAKVVEMHNEGRHYMDISKEFRRDPVEILLVLIHVADQNRYYLRPLTSTKRAVNSLQAKRGQYSVLAKVEKVKKGIPTVIEIDGKRYVYEPKGR